MSARAAAASFAGVLGLALWFSAGVWSLAYALLFALAVAPGVAIGVVVFGHRHSIAWVGGALVGYGLTQLALWAALALGFTSVAGAIISWAALLAAAALILRAADRPLVAVPRWTAPDTAALFLVMLLAPVLMGITYRNLGRTDASGNQYYRAYFTADFLWHSALVSELEKGTLPPRNPYLAPRPMNYYWTYFLLPATVARHAPAALPALQDVQRLLKTNAMLVGSLMVAALFLFVRSGMHSAPGAALAVMMVVLAASAEGLYAIIDLLARGRPLAQLLDINVDAVTAWPPFGGLRIDNIPRSLWYTPQHTTSVALGLTAVTTLVLAGAAVSMAGVVFAGLALGLATTMNPLLGAAFSILYAVCIVVDGVRAARPITIITRHAAAAIFVVAAVGWAAASRVVDGAGSALDIGFSGFSRNSPVLTLMLSLGPVLLPALFGILRRDSDAAKRAAVLGGTGIAVGLALLYFVRVSEASWVGFRAGQILLVTIPVLLAGTLEMLPRGARIALVTLVLLVGLPTTAIDTWNAQDIWNRRPGPGFKWTLWTTPDQQQAFEWIQRNTPAEAIVQMEPMVRGREHWTLIPSFAARRMAAGLPISLLPIPEYAERSAIVQQLFATMDANEASTLARRLRLDYLYVDHEDVAAYPEGTAKFDRSPERFTAVFRNTTVRVYQVR